MTSFDFEQTVGAHPWRTVGLAFFVGAGIAFVTRSRNPIMRAVAGAVAGTAFELGRELAVQRATRVARSWLDLQNAPYAPAPS